MVRLVVSVSRRFAEPRADAPRAVLRTAAKQERTHSAGLGIRIGLRGFVSNGRRGKIESGRGNSSSKTGVAVSAAGDAANGLSM